MADGVDEWDTRDGIVFKFYFKKLPNIQFLFFRDCDVCGACNNEVDKVDLDYDELFPDEVEPKGFGNKGLRRRRQARSGRQPRSTSKKYCVRFDVR